MPSDPPDDRALRASAERVGAALRARGWRFAAAESCTGGWIGKVVTDLAGSSDWFDSSAVTYSNRAKVALLGVAEALLAEHGAVSEPVARAMADGVRRRTGCDAAVAVTGVAGPAGGTAAKPVGLVCFAWAAGGKTSSAAQLFAGDREAIRRQAVAVALDGLADAVDVPA